ncbi:MAG: S9 family peptidase, partial [Allosphingosinicella sp.]
MIHRFLVAASAIALLGAATPPAPPVAASDPAILFGAREGVRQISLSPSGERVAFIAPGKGQSNALFIAEAAGGRAPTRVFTADGKPARLTECHWLTEKRLVCTLYMLLTNLQADQIWPGMRIIALDTDGGNPRMVSVQGTPDDLGVTLTGGDIVDWLPGEDGALLVSRYYMPQSKLNTRFVETRQGLGVDRVDTTDLQTRTVELPKMHGMSYLSDGHGNVRIMGVVEQAAGVDSGRISWYYRPKGGHE